MSSEIVSKYGEPFLQAHILERTLVIEDVSSVYLNLVESGVGEVLLLEAADPTVDILPSAHVDSQRGEDILWFRILAFRFPRLIDIRQIHPKSSHSKGLNSIYHSLKQ